MAESNPEKSAKKKRGLSEYLQLVSLPATVVLMGVIVADVGGRMIFKEGIIATYSLSSLLVVVIGFCSLAVSWKEGQFIRLDLLTNRFPERIRVALDIFVLLLGIGLCGSLIWLSTSATIYAFSSASTPSGMSMPLWPWKLFIPIGTSFLCYEIIARLVRTIRQLIRKNGGAP